MKKWSETEGQKIGWLLQIHGRLKRRQLKTIRQILTRDYNTNKKTYPHRKIGKFKIPEKDTYEANICIFTKK